MLFPFCKRLLYSKYTIFFLIVQLFIDKMSENAEKIILEFIKTEFPIRKIRNSKNKWANAIIIPEGYIRKKREPYFTNPSLNTAIITAEIIQIICNVFGCEQKYAQKLTTTYLKSKRL